MWPLINKVTHRSGFGMWFLVIGGERRLIQGDPEQAE